MAAAHHNVDHAEHDERKPRAARSEHSDGLRKATQLPRCMRRGAPAEQVDQHPCCMHTHGS
jgi:hypothetical protein